MPPIDQLHELALLIGALLTLVGASGFATSPDKHALVVSLVFMAVGAAIIHALT